MSTAGDRGSVPSSCAIITAKHTRQSYHQCRVAEIRSSELSLGIPFGYKFKT